MVVAPAKKVRKRLRVRRRRGVEEEAIECERAAIAARPDRRSRGAVPARAKVEPKRPGDARLAAVVCLEEPVRRREFGVEAQQVASLRENRLAGIVPRVY